MLDIAATDSLLPVAHPHVPDQLSAPSAVVTYSVARATHRDTGVAVSHIDDHRIKYHGRSSRRERYTLATGHTVGDVVETRTSSEEDRAELARLREAKAERDKVKSPFA